MSADEVREPFQRQFKLSSKGVTVWTTLALRAYAKRWGVDVKDIDETFNCLAYLMRSAVGVEQEDGRLLVVIGEQDNLVRDWIDEEDWRRRNGSKT